MATAPPSDSPKRTIRLAGKPRATAGFVDREAIGVQASLRRFSSAQSVAAVVDEEDVEAESVDEQLRALQAVADVAGVAVKVQEGGAACAPDPPAVESDPAGRREGKRLGGQAIVRRLGAQRAVGEEDEAALARHEENRNDQDEQQNDGKSCQGEPPVHATIIGAGFL